MVCVLAESVGRDADTKARPYLGHNIRHQVYGHAHLAKMAESKPRSNILVLVGCLNSCLQLFILLCAYGRELLRGPELSMHGLSLEFKFVNLTFHYTHHAIGCLGRDGDSLVVLEDPILAAQKDVCKTACLTVRKDL